MPQELGSIPEIVIGHITGGEVVLRDVTYQIDNPGNLPPSPQPFNPEFQGICGYAYLPGEVRPGDEPIYACFDPKNVVGDVPNGVQIIADNGTDSFVAYRTAALAKQAQFGTIAPGPEATSKTIDPVPISPKKPAQANERMVMFDRANLNYLTAEPADALDMMGRNTQIEFIGSFDRNTAEYVADQIAKNPPGNALEIKAKQIPAALAELATIQSVLQSGAELLSSREVVLRKLIAANRLLPNPTSDQVYMLAHKIYDDARTLSPAQMDPNYGATKEQIAEYMNWSQQSAPSRVGTGSIGYSAPMSIPAESVVYSAGK